MHPVKEILYSNNVKIRDPPPVVVLLVIDAGSMLGGINPIGKCIGLGGSILNIVYQYLHYGENEGCREEEG